MAKDESSEPEFFVRFYRSVETAGGLGVARVPVRASLRAVEILSEGEGWQPATGNIWESIRSLGDDAVETVDAADPDAVAEWDRRVAESLPAARSELRFRLKDGAWDDVLEGLDLLVQQCREFDEPQRAQEVKELILALQGDLGRRVIGGGVITALQVNAVVTGEKVPLELRVCPDPLPEPSPAFSGQPVGSPPVVRRSVGFKVLGDAVQGESGGGYDMRGIVEENTVRETHTRQGNRPPDLHLAAEVLSRNVPELEPHEVLDGLIRWMSDGDKTGWMGRAIYDTAKHVREAWCRSQDRLSPDSESAAEAATMDHVVSMAAVRWLDGLSDPQRTRLHSVADIMGADWDELDEVLAPYRTC